jgi:hypothetical protein
LNFPMADTIEYTTDLTKITHHIENSWYSGEIESRVILNLHIFMKEHIYEHHTVYTYIFGLTLEQLVMIYKYHNIFIKSRIIHTTLKDIPRFYPDKNKLCESIYDVIYLHLFRIHPG